MYRLLGWKLRKNKDYICLIQLYILIAYYNARPTAWNLIYLMSLFKVGYCGFCSFSGEIKNNLYKFCWKGETFILAFNIFNWVNVWSRVPLEARKRLCPLRTHTSHTHIHTYQHGLISLVRLVYEKCHVITLGQVLWMWRVGRAGCCAWR